MFCTLNGVRRIEAMVEVTRGIHTKEEVASHPSTTATVPVSLGTLPVAAQVSQRHQYEITLADIEA